MREKVANIILPDQDESTFNMAELIEEYAVIFFYPKDLTSGCSKEAADFNEYLSKFNDGKCAVIGISPDSPKTHKKFIDTLGLGYPLLADVDKTVCEAYGVWKEKSMYGRKYFGVERSTFLVSKTLDLIASWRKVKVPGHVNNVYDTLKNHLESVK
ncbi:MAG: peroxiredoxin [Pseudomonadota bacterium]|nr:peroxiredoxin [Pseudomonadota bacterium]